MYSIGVDIGGSKIAAGVVGKDYTLISKKSLPFPHTGNPLDSIATIRTLVGGLIAGEQSCDGGNRRHRPRRSRQYRLRSRRRHRRAQSGLP